MDEPIAIIGLDARLPGDGDSPESFYNSLLAGRSARTEVPPERYNADAFWHPDAERGGSSRTKYGHFLTGSVTAFDAPFFSITPAEARSMDPQQRGMLESVYKALENAGVPLTKAAGTQTGVYVGCFTADYNDITVKDLDVPSKYAATGTVASMLSNRVSWFFDFKGPSITVDTACSSSLVAAHEACMSLKLREISMAIVGGCNLILSPEMALKLDAAGVLGPDGKSYSFDHRGNGYARGEGFGVLVLKRVSDAIRDGDMIRAVIRNSSSNQDGRSPGITQPTKAGQAALIRHVYSRAGLDPSLTRFFEAHGTGTAVGDPIEASAISEVFTPYRSPEQPLYIGALKSNVGHLEGAAGVAAMIKGVFTLERGIIPPNIWFEKANPKIQESWNLKFPTEATVWPQSGLRRMSINSFGIGGSNAHVVMDDALHFLQKYHLVGNHRTEAYPSRANLLNVPSLNGVNGGHAANGVNGTNGTANGLPNGRRHRSDSGVDLEQQDVAPSGPAQLFVLSSYDQDGVSRMRDAYNDYLDSRSKNDVNPGEVQFFRDLSYTLASKRTHHAWRSFSIADSQSALRSALPQMPQAVRAKSEPRLAFIFTGQGAQWPAMGMELMKYPVFQQSLLAADRYLNNLGCPWSLTFELSKDADSSRIRNPEFCQPICTALQVALVDLLASWNIHPHAIAGHSSGEIAGAYAIGAISKEAAWKISYYRGKLSAQLSHSESQTKTGMAAVGQDLQGTQASIDRINDMGGEGTLQIACMNSWQSHTVSGSISKIDALVEMLNGEKIFARKLDVDMAYHSQYMKAMAEEYLESMGEIEPGTCKSAFKVQFYSSTTGTAVSPSKLRDPAYWVENLVSPVRFCESVTALVRGSTETSKVNGHAPAASITDILEIGPHSALKGPLANIVKQAKGDKSIEYHSMLKRQYSAVDSSLEAAGSLFCHGYDVDLLEVNGIGDSSGYKVLMLTDLPSYTFNHSKEYWTESKLSRDFRLRPVNRHELLGVPLPDWDKDNAVWRNYIRISENPWIEDHKVSGDVLYPAAGMLVMAIEASRQISDKSKTLKGFRFRDVSFHAALKIPHDAQGVESHFHLRPYRDTTLPVATLWHEFQLCTLEDDQWREHCRGLIQTEYEPESEGSLEDQMVQNRCDEELKNALTNCTTRVPVDKAYRKLKESGLEFGPTFQTLSDICLGPELKVLTRVESSVSKIKKLMPYEYIQPHLVHPATLDGIIHTNIVPIVLGAKNAREARVPIYANELWVSANPNALHDSYLVTAQTNPRGRQEAESIVTAIQPETGRLMVYASGLVFKTIPGNSSQESSSLSRHGAYNIDWKPDPTFLTDKQASQAFGLSMTAEEDPSSWMQACESLCFFYIHRFIESLTKEGIEKMDWHHKKYVAWMENVINTSSQEVTCSDVSELERRVEESGVPEGKLIIAVGQALEEMLGGTRDPLDVIFGNKIAENVYRHGLGSKRCYVQLCNYIDALAHKNPDMQILEIGAGTGGATRPVMETLTQNGQRYQNYTFTDISPSFFEQAKNIFKEELSSMTFKVLNVEKDPLEQGFAAQKYDLIIAANVLHATKKIDVSLSNARSLLKPGGKLMLFEITNPAVLLGTFCFGVLPGWWLSEDDDRIWGPLMTAESWKTHLIDSGYNGLDAVFNDFPEPSNRMSSILVSTVPTSGSVSQKVISSTYIAIDDTSSFQKDIAEALLAVMSQHEVCEITTITSLGEKDITNATCILLPEVEAPVLENMLPEVFESVKKIVNQSKALVWLARGGSLTTAAPDMELVTGLARVARLERPNFKFITASFEQADSLETIVEKCNQIVGTLQNGTENSFRISNGLIHIPRLVKAAYLTEHIQAQTGYSSVMERKFGEDPSRSLVLQIGTLGQLDTLRFEDDALFDIPLRDYEVEFKTMASGISQRDLDSARGHIQELALGAEASGIVTRVGSASRFKVGDKVFGLSLSGTLKSHVRSSDGFVAKMPESMSWTEAASIPVAYITAYVALHEIATIRKGERILIHSGDSATGQAAIQLAQLKEVDIFTTVENSEKREFLAATYGIPLDHIFSCQGLSFKRGIQYMTGGRGVDIALNCLSGEGLWNTLDCIAPFGRLVELGSGNINSNSRIPMNNFHRNIHFASFELDFRALHDPMRTQDSFQKMVELVLNHMDQTVQRTPTTVYPFSKVRDAFRQMQSDKNTGKLVLEPHDEDLVPMVPSQKPVSQFSPQASYVVVGGLGGLGRSIARWMVSRGAKNLILVSRRGPTHDAAKELVKELESKCVKVATPLCDATDSETLKTVINECLTSMPPIKGCIQGSMVLRDNRLDNMSLDEWNEAIRSKVNTSWNLHNVLDRELDFFVLLSSTMGIAGNAEQSNYAAGSTFQDALARYLAAQGVHAVSIDLPVISGVGFVAEKPELMDYMRSTGWSFMDEEAFQAALDYYCHPSKEPVSLLQSQVVPRFWLPQETAAEGYELPIWRHDPLFKHLTQTEALATEKVVAEKDINHAALLAAATSMEASEKIVLEALMLKISRLLSVEVSNLDPAKPLHAYGVDSLVAVELRSWLAKGLNAEVSVFDITNKSSIYQLSNTITARSKLTPKFEGVN
ncbi:beta-ketoacyl synthase domain-containing protein [Xylogone sp. PMI_703]|nr:beta-ketoacyl synthase domain-containing protein [Xylogone sp. PMI_703]